MIPGSGGAAAVGAALAAGLWVLASPATAAQQAPEAQPASANSIPVSETAAHPLDYDPVTNEHTAKMTMARASALDYYQAGKYRQAEAKFLEALAEAKLGFDAKDPHIASAMNNLAEFYRNTSQFDKALDLYQQALAQLESIYGERHWLYVSAMHNLALCHEAAGDLGAAVDTMGRVMKLRLSMFGARHFLYADSMFALGLMMLKQAQQGAQRGAQEARGWWGAGGGGGARAAAAAERKALGYMEDALAALEDAESVQVNVVLAWLSELGRQYRRRGRPHDALKCARKALHHFSNDKGQLHANASQLSDELVELLLEVGDKKEAKEVAEACAAARQQVFGRELAVAQAWLRLAALEAQQDKVDVAALLQHASNAAALSGELLQDYSRPRAANWLGGGGAAGAGGDKSAKRAKAAHLHASSLKVLAEHAPAPAGPSKTASPARQHLEGAVATAEAGAAAAAQHLQRLGAAGGAGTAAAAFDELAGLYVELQLLLLECLEALAGVLAATNGDAAAEQRLREVQARQQELSRQLLQ